MSVDKKLSNIKTKGGSRPGSGRKPGSKNKATRPIREAAAVHCEAALAVIVKLMHDAESPANVRLQAANAVLDRAYGKP